MQRACLFAEPSVLRALQLFQFLGVVTELWAGQVRTDETAAYRPSARVHRAVNGSLESPGRNTNVSGVRGGQNGPGAGDTSRILESGDGMCDRNPVRTPQAAGQEPRPAAAVSQGVRREAGWPPLGWGRRARERGYKVVEVACWELGLTEQKRERQRRDV